MGCTHFDRAWNAIDGRHLVTDRRSQALSIPLNYFTFQASAISVTVLSPIAARRLTSLAFSSLALHLAAHSGLGVLGPAVTTLANRAASSAILTRCVVVADLIAVVILIGGALSLAGLTLSDATLAHLSLAGRSLALTPQLLACAVRGRAIGAFAGAVCSEGAVAVVGTWTVALGHGRNGQAKHHDQSKNHGS